jgi:hypothetical protein
MDEVGRSSAELRRYVASRFNVLLETQDFLDALPGHLLPDLASQQRADIILERMATIARW